MLLLVIMSLAACNNNNHKSSDQSTKYKIYYIDKNFKLRRGMKIGLKVTLRGRRMYEFLDRLIGMAIPRVKDFRGLPAGGFDGKGNYNMGLTEQTVFPEINPDKVQTTQGMNIAIVTTARTDEQARRLLSLLGMPFRT